MSGNIVQPWRGYSRATGERSHCSSARMRSTPRCSAVESNWRTSSSTILTKVRYPTGRWKSLLDTQDVGKQDGDILRLAQWSAPPRRYRSTTGSGIIDSNNRSFSCVALVEHSSWFADSTHLVESAVRSPIFVA